MEFENDGFIHSFFLDFRLKVRKRVVGLPSEAHKVIIKLKFLWRKLIERVKEEEEAMRKQHLLGTYNLSIVERPILFSSHLTKTASQAT